MARKILTKQDTKTAFVITAASLAAGAGRQSTLVANSDNRKAASIYVNLMSGTAPTAGKVYSVYLIRKSGTFAVDGAGDSDAAFTPVNAVLLGTLVVTNNANTAFKAVFHTAMAGPLGPNWGIAIVNNTDQALHATAGNHSIEFAYDYPEVQ